MSRPTARIAPCSRMGAISRRIRIPTWLGYSIGRWEGDTFVVTTAGFNDRGWLDSAGHPQTESLRVTERFRRRDFGHMDFEIRSTTRRCSRSRSRSRPSGYCAGHRPPGGRVRERGDQSHMSGGGGAVEARKRLAALRRRLRAGARPRVRRDGPGRPDYRARAERAEGAAARAVGNNVHVHSHADRLRVRPDAQGRVTHVLVRDGGEVRKAARKPGPTR